MKEQIIKEVSQNSGFPEKIIEKSIKRFLAIDYFDGFNELNEEDKRKLFHRIKGTSLTIGLIEIGEFAKKIEKKLQDGIDINDDVKKLKSKIDDFKNIFLIT